MRAIDAQQYRVGIAGPAFTDATQLSIAFSSTAIDRRNLAKRLHPICIDLAGLHSMKFRNSVKFGR